MGLHDAIHALECSLTPDHVIIKGASSYNELNKSHLSVSESELKPAAIILPRNKDDAVRFMQVIRPFVLHDGVQFAIRGAGQQPLPGCSNIDERGITLDLRYIGGIEVKDGVVSIGAGERWSAVYEKLTELNLGVTGSRSALGGIGGLALSGGLSFFSSREGFICDNMLNYEIVLPSAEVVNANATEHPDLWRALRGGGNNFGVITRFDLRTFEQGPFWGGAVFYFPSSFPSQIKAYCEELNRSDSSHETHIMMSQWFSSAFIHLGGHFCMNQLYYTQAVENPVQLEPFVNVQPQIQVMNSMRMMTLKEAADEQAKQAVDGIRCLYMNTTIKADSETLIAASELFTTAFQPLKSLEGWTCALTLQAYPVSLLQKCDNILGLDHLNGPLMSILLLSRWKNKGDDVHIIETFKNLIVQMDATATSRGTALPYKYSNYAYSFQDPIGSYGSDNHQKLQEISKKYDVDGVFRKGVPGGFKLF